MIKVILTIIIILIVLATIYIGYDIYGNLFSSPLQFHVNYTQLQAMPSYNGSLQFYDNMRFSSKRIGYSIEPICNDNKKQDMIAAFNYIENMTVLEFYSSSIPEIIVDCSNEKIEKEPNFFVGGTGGSEGMFTNTNSFNIIPDGRIILYDYNRCEFPLVPIHELLHVLGFNHSSSKTSVMYPISSCQQVVTNDIIDEIQRLYSAPSLPDLYFSNISAFRKGSYLNLNLTARNSGLVAAESVNVTWYAGNEQGEFKLEDIEAGGGKKFYVENLKIGRVNRINLSIVAGQEIDFGNNNASLILTGA